jgi:hypothetical protein
MANRFPDLGYISMLWEILSSKFARMVKVQTCILEVPGSNPDGNTYPD